MQPIRSVLWIGPAESLAKSGVADAAILDVTWVCDAEDALALPLSQFDAAVLVGSEPEQIVSALRKMRARPGMPRVLVCLPEREAGWTRDILAAGAADVLVAFSESEVSKVSEVSALLRCIEQRPEASLEAKLRSVIGRSPPCAQRSHSRFERNARQPRSSSAEKQARARKCSRARSTTRAIAPKRPSSRSTAPPFPTRSSRASCSAT
jgi:hypothetical protein